MIINTNRILCFSISCFLAFWVQAQTNVEGRKNSNVNIVYDVDSIPIMEEETFYYLQEQNKFVPASGPLPLKYKGGYKRFFAYFDSCYYHRPDYNEDELNMRISVVMLFDADLNIKEIRIHKRDATINKKYDYDALVKRILFSTAEKWEKINPQNKSKWYWVWIPFLKLK
jgi:hypothetical protein